MNDLTAELESVLSNRPVRRCPACEVQLVVIDPRSPNLCSACGHIFWNDGGKPRNMTAAEKKILNSPDLREKGIRNQQEVVRRLVG